MTSARCFSLKANRKIVPSIIWYANLKLAIRVIEIVAIATLIFMAYDWLQSTHNPSLSQWAFLDIYGRNYVRLHPESRSVPLPNGHGCWDWYTPGELALLKDDV